MKTAANRIEEVYNQLGRILKNPQLFSLAEPARGRLVNALTAMQKDLHDELAERNQGSAGSELAVELSQDADTQSPGTQE